MKRLIYRISEPTQIIERDSKRMTIEESGQPTRSQKIPVGKARTRNIATGDVLKVNNEDLDYLIPALQWRTGDYNVDFAMPINRGWKSTEWQIPGRFTPTLTKKEIHQIVEDYKLLGKHFRRYEDVHGPRAQEMMIPMLEHVLNMIRIIVDNSSNLKMRTQISKEAPIPDWVKRTLELRSQAAGRSGSEG